MVIRNANVTTARTNIDEALQVTEQIFFTTLTNKRDSLLAKVRALSSDYAFKPVAHTNEHQTVLSALTSYQARLNADIMLLLTLNGDIIADTQNTELTQQPFYLPKLIKQAMASEYGEADTFAFIDNNPYLLVVVPLFSPEASHWIIIGFLLTDNFANQLQKTTNSQVSIIRKIGGSKASTSKTSALKTGSRKSNQVVASTLQKNKRATLQHALKQTPWQFGQNFDLTLDQQSYVSLAIPIINQQNNQWYALLQRSLDKALLPYQQLHIIVASGFTAALLLLIFGGAFIAKKVTKPITTLTEGAEKIEQGHYDLTIKVDQHDELGQLAQRFNSMAKGLAERAKVRSLLGKVVSSSIAEQLLTKGVELGGEERQVTILFSDIRNFTSLCEQQSAKEIITLLNTLLSRFSILIDEHQGVVDKYIGDAVMALFGAPVTDIDQAQHAVLAAMAMQIELTKLNDEFKQQHAISLGLGIGVNTDIVLAGNMGSHTRLNYTVLGDGVNLSARLEGLTKFYQVPILVSEATMALCPDIYFILIDRVRVKGKQQGVNIYQPIALKNILSEQSLKICQLFNQAINLYQQQQWQVALGIFQQLSHSQASPQVKSPTNSHLYQLYCQRCTDLLKAKISHWDGIYTHQQK